MEQYRKKNRADKIRVDRLAEDKEGIAPRLNEIIRWTRYTFFVLLALTAMASLFFLRDAVTVILRLFGV
jgi:hypothetical protein